ncbi:Extracellular protein [Penicillium coprophilum]|uniref:Extracellular protein n=1 Tax=Penicillium coprophilum TaxID=36646 RepID=UPI0023983EBA|nr:Extracellular protein [Penicillium coprophilum]KAJ5178601.1 Extracellular protein [Penicillium coprophilum]
MKGTLILSGLLATVASAHMQLSKPYPIRSPLNKDSKGEKDYSYTNPLSSSGSDYPCKGYANDKFEAVATWQPGSSQEMTLEGSAVHDGGSCQLSLTYDKGKTFKVIESIEGDCPIAKKYQFEVPSDAPSGDALFAWTWFNKVGNREMYMNCAMITIGGSNKRSAAVDSMDQEANKGPMHKLNEKPTEKGPNNHADNQTKNAKSSFSSLPELFVANVNQAGKCVTIEGQAVHFPKPGPKLIGKAEGPGYKCSDHAPFLDTDSKSETKPATTETTTKSEKKPATTLTSAAKSEKKPNTTSTTTAAKAASQVSQAFETAAADDHVREASTEGSAKNQFSKYVVEWSCHSGDIICAPDGLSFAMCSNGKPIFMGSVAAGTICRSGVITARQ